MPKPKADNTGPSCPHCGTHASQVVDTRTTVNGVRRNRQCAKCGTRWTTIEIPADQLKTLLRVVANWEFDKPVTRQRIGMFKSRYEVPPEKRAIVQVYKNKGLRMPEIAQLLNLKEKNHDKAT